MYKVYQDVKINHIWVPRHLSGHTKLNVKYESIAVTFPHHRVTKMKPSVTCHVSRVTRLSATDTVCVPTAFLRQPSCSGFLYLLMTYVSLLIRPRSLVKSQHNFTCNTSIRFFQNNEGCLITFCIMELNASAASSSIKLQCILYSDNDICGILRNTNIVLETRFIVSSVL